MRLYPLLCIAALAACSQTPDTMPTTANSNPATDSVVIHPIHHASLVLRAGATTIYVDPYDGAPRYAGEPAPDLVLITDIHPDHLDTATLAGLSLGHARFVVPQAVMDQLPARYKANARVLANGDHMEEQGIGIEAVPMYNLPGPREHFHEKGRGNGYVITALGKRIYVSGDTEDIPEMRALTHIDVAFVCMNLPYTMTVEQAADAVLTFKPKVVYPFHYRGPDGLSDVQHFKQLVNAVDPRIEVRLVDWYK